jgi:hypothetical protein
VSVSCFTSGSMVVSSDILTSSVSYEIARIILALIYGTI